MKRESSAGKSERPLLGLVLLVSSYGVKFTWYWELCTSFLELDQFPSACLSWQMSTEDDKTVEILACSCGAAVLYLFGAGKKWKRRCKNVKKRTRETD